MQSYNNAGLPYTDELCGYAVSYPRYKHYVYDTRDLWDNCLAICVPRRTTGSIEVEINNIIKHEVFAIYALFFLIQCTCMNHQ